MINQASFDKIVTMHYAYPPNADRPIELNFKEEPDETPRPPSRVVSRARSRGAMRLRPISQDKTAKRKTIKAQEEFVALQDRMDLIRKENMQKGVESSLENNKALVSLLNKRRSGMTLPSFRAQKSTAKIKTGVT